MDDYLEFTVENKWQEYTIKFILKPAPLQHLHTEAFTELFPSYRKEMMKNKVHHKEYCVIKRFHVSCIKYIMFPVHKAGIF